MLTWLEAWRAAGWRLFVSLMVERETARESFRILPWRVLFQTSGGRWRTARRNCRQSAFPLLAYDWVPPLRCRRRLVLPLRIGWLSGRPWSMAGAMCG